MLNCIKLYALDNTIIGNGLQLIGSQCWQYVICKMNNRLLTNSSRSDFDLVTPINTTSAWHWMSMYWSRYLSFVCIVCGVHKQYKQYIVEANDPCNCDLSYTYMFFHWAESWDSPSDTYHTLLCKQLNDQHAYTAVRHETCRPWATLLSWRLGQTRALQANHFAGGTGTPSAASCR